MPLKMFYELIPNQRNGENLVYQSFIYNHDKEVPDGKRWRCQTRSSHGFIVIHMIEWIEGWHWHNHEDSSVKLRRITLMKKIKDPALVTTERPNENVIRELTNLEDKTSISD